MTMRPFCLPVRVAVAAASLSFGILAPPAVHLAVAQASLPPASLVVAARDPYAGYIAEAAHRFGIPEHWIRIVMRAESAGDVRALSHAGARGLMQVMPATWAELRVRYGLGRDPWDPRDNILAGAAYLREMHDRFGAPGFLAAYNAGPRRYEEHLATGRPLPLETRAYLADLAPRLGLAAPDAVAVAPPDPNAWTRAPLFVARFDASPDGDPATSNVQPSRRLDADAGTAAVQSNGLFVPRLEGRE